MGFAGRDGFAGRRKEANLTRMQKKVRREEICRAVFLGLLAILLAVILL